jgi:hypothetical protein
MEATIQHCLEVLFDGVGGGLFLLLLGNFLQKRQSAPEKSGEEEITHKRLLVRRIGLGGVGSCLILGAVIVSQLPTRKVNQAPPTSDTPRVSPGNAQQPPETGTAPGNQATPAEAPTPRKREAGKPTTPVPVLVSPVVAVVEIHLVIV